MHILGDAQIKLGPRRWLMTPLDEAEHARRHAVVMFSDAETRLFLRVPAEHQRSAADAAVLPLRFGPGLELRVELCPGGLVLVLPTAEVGRCPE